MENIEKKETDKIQIVCDPYEENVEYSYEINKNNYLANAFIVNGRFGPVSSFYKVKTDKLVAIKKISNAYENPTKGKNVLKQLSIL